MIETSFISGELGRAIYSESDTWWIYNVDSLPRPAKTNEIAELELSSTCFRATKAVSLVHLQEQLIDEVDYCNSTFLVLCILDPESSLSLRLECAQAVETSFEKNDYWTRARDRLLSAPLPLEARAIRSNITSYLKTFPRLVSLIRIIYDSQYLIDEIVALLERLTTKLSSEETALLKRRLIENGIVAEIVRAAQSPNASSFNSAMVSLIQKVRLDGYDSRVAPVLVEIRASLERLLFDKPASQRNLPIEIGSRREKASRRSSATIEDLLAEEPRQPYILVRPQEAKSQVDKQIEAIKGELYSGKYALINRYLEELVKFQLNNSEREHLAKSLCNLASTFMSVNQLDVANQLANYAVSLGVEDPVVFTTRAEIYKGMGLFEASLRAYEEAKIRFPDTSYAWNGYADVLKEAGRFDEARSAYKEAQKRYPDSSVPRNGYIATLRAQGKTFEALQEALILARDFQDDAISITTLASALTANGKYDLAIRQYEQVIQMGKIDIYTMSGYVRALNANGQEEEALRRLDVLASRTSDGLALSTLLVGQLRRVGKISESISLAQKLLAIAPVYAPLIYQLATSYVIRGDVNTNEITLPQENLRSEMDWAGYRIFLLSLVHKGEYTRARDLLLTAIDRCVWQSWRVQFVTLLGFTQLKLKKAQEAIKTLEIGFDALDEHLKQSRLVIMGAAERVRGRDGVADTLLKRIIKTKDKSILDFRQAALETKKASWHIPVGTELNLLLAAA